MVGKKAQVTLFIIVGLVILILIGLVVFFKANLFGSSSEENLQESLVIPSNVEEVNSYVQGCLEDKLKYVVALVSLQGGYSNVPEYAVEYNTERLNTSVYIPYYLYNSEKFEVNKSGLESEISSGLGLLVDECASIPDFPYSISVDRDKVKIVSFVRSSSVESNVFLPMTIKKGTSLIKLEKFNVEVKSSLNTLHDAAIKISDVQYAKGNKICLTCLLDLVDKNKVGLEMSEIEIDTGYVVIYTLKDIPEGNLIFNFAHKFVLAQEGGLR